jgi:hypothetical protein
MGPKQGMYLNFCKKSIKKYTSLTSEQEFDGGSNGDIFALGIAIFGEHGQKIHFFALGERKNDNRANGLRKSPFRPNLKCGNQLQ